MDFSFGLLTYNSGKYVVEALFSIKNQIDSFFYGKEVQLVISDDGSTDDTVVLVKQWLRKYGDLFCEAVLIASPNNQGTVINYNRLIHSLKTERFHIFAADDLLGPCDINQYFEGVSQGHCKCMFPVSLRDNVIYIEKRRMVRFLPLIHKKEIKGKKAVNYIMLGSYIHTPSTLFLKQEYKEIIEQFGLGFKVLEDDPRWYKFAKSNIAFSFCFEPLMIYRYHDESVAHAKGQKRLSNFDIDLENLNKIYLRDEGISFCMKLYIKSKLKFIEGNKSVVTVYVLTREILYLWNLLVDKVTQRHKNEYIEVSNTVNAFERYYKRISAEAIEFIESLGA